MMESSGRRVFFILLVFFAFFASLFASRNVAVRHFLFNRSFSSSFEHIFSSSQINITEEAFLERLAVFFPDIIVRLSKLSSEQQKKIIEQVRCDMIAFAFANGHNSEQAQKLGRIVAVVLSKAISHPSVSGSYF
ncbi:hypothetical protein [Bartonella florencae]|uniref:hypothetical protein n=1 Tax=Bartonella florencae TaxID=928210 RepID=UPI00068895D6|nr:hypothetical protein [Bartonella florencae]